MAISCQFTCKIIRPSAFPAASWRKPRGPWGRGGASHFGKHYSRLILCPQIQYTENEPGRRDYYAESISASPRLSLVEQKWEVTMTPLIIDMFSQNFCALP